MKKLISLLVVLAMLMAMVPAVYAEETSTETTTYQEVTIPEAIALAEEGSDTKYLVRGTITEVANTTYGNMYIEDADGNSLYIYGVYGVDGVDRYDAMETQPVAGDEVLLLGVLTTYNGNAQMKNAWLQELNGEALVAPEVAPDPEADTELTIAEAIALGQTKAHDTYTEGKYYVTGEITEIYNTTYGNMYIQDAEGNTLTIYGTFDADGTNRFDAMENQPAVGDTVTVYGVIGKYNGTPQMKNGWLQESAAEEEPETPVEGPLEGNVLVVGNNELTAEGFASTEYTFTAPQAGTLYLTIRNYSCNGVEYGEDMLSYAWSEIQVDGAALTAMQTTLEVTEGQVLTVVMTSDSDPYVSNLYLSFEGFYQETPGSEFSPIKLTLAECPTTTVEIPAGGEVYYSLDYEFYEHVLYVYGENAYVAYEGWLEDGTWGEVYVYAENGVVTYNMWEYEIRIGNTGDTAAVFNLDAEMPLGLESNPATLVIGDNVTAMSADMFGYYYTWTATEPGTLTVTVSGDSSWAFLLQNGVTAEEYYYFEHNGDPNTASVTVDAGDTVILMLRLIELVNWDSIDGTLTATAEFTAGEGEDRSMVLGNNYIKVRNGYGDPVTKEYTYVAEQTGTLYVTFRSFGCWGNNWDESYLTDEYYLQGFSLLLNGEQVTVFKNSIEVTEGDSVVLTIASLDGYPYETNVWLSYEGFYEEPVGSELNPVKVYVDDLPTYTVDIPAGEALYYEFEYAFEDYTLYIYGENAYIVVDRYNYDTDQTEPYYIYAVDGVVEYDFSDGLTIQIGNAGEAADSFLMEGEIPLGIRNNPDQLIIGEQTATVPADSWVGYWYTWTAPEAGTLTITVTGDNWAYELTNDTTGDYAYGYERSGDSNTVSLTVAAGDVIMLNLLAIDADWNYCGGELTVVAEFATEGGTEEKGLLGDVNGDGWVDSEDAMLVLQYDAVMIGEDELDLTVGDVSGDGWVDSEDAMLILQYDAMLIDKFPADAEPAAEELELGYNMPEVAEGEEKVYTWTAEEDTLFVLNMVSNNWTYRIDIADAEGTVRSSIDETMVNMTIVKVSAGDVVTLTIGTADGTAAAVEFTTATCAGTEASPIEINFVWNENYDAAAINVDMPAGEFVFNMWRGAGMALTIDGVETEMTGDGWFNPIVFTATVAEAGVVAMELAYPVGAYQNPDQLELGYGSADIEENSQMGYWYTYTAEEDGLFVLTMACDNWFYSGSIMHADGTASYPDGHHSGEVDNDGNLFVVPMQILEMKAGDKLILNFGTSDYAAATVEFNTAFCAGTEASPIEINFVWNENYDAAAINVDMPAGEFVFNMWRGAGMALTIDGVETEMTGDGWFNPIVFTATVAEAGVVTMELNYPVGAYQNPEQLELGYGSADIEENSQMGYWYTYTAETDGLFVLTMTCDNWFYSGSIMHADGTASYPDGHHSAEVDREDNLLLVPMQVLEMKAGDQLILNFGTSDYAAATVEFNTAFCAGTDEDPVMVEFAWNEEYTAASVNIDMPAGEYVYGARNIAGTVLTVNGVETEYTVGMGRYPCTFVINNEEAGIVALELYYPVGTAVNPEIVEEGEYTAEIEAGNYDGYYYNFIAAADGTLTVTVNAETGWFYTVSNLTTGVYGDANFSDENSNTLTIEVSAGDVIEIIVNAYDPANGMGLGGTVSVALAFAPAAE